MSMFSLGGKTALITGATRGIGQAMAIALAEAGADVIMIQRDTSSTITKENIEVLGRKASIYTCNLGDNAAVKTVVAEILNDGYHIDILVNCGGIQRRHKAEEFPDDDWNEVLQVNLTTVFTLCREVGKYMIDNGRKGKIINVASLMTFQGGINVPAYAAAKGGIGQLTQALSNEWSSKGINVNALAPGYIATDMTAALRNDDSRAKSILERIPAARWGTPEDFKGPVVFLASGASDYMCGEVMVVDGGWMGR